MDPFNPSVSYIAVIYGQVLSLYLIIGPPMLPRGSNVLGSFSVEEIPDN